MNIKEIEGAIEAILFAVGEKVSIKKISEAVETDIKTVECLIKNLTDKYENEQRGFNIIQIDDEYQMCTSPKYFDYVKAIMKSPAKKSLTQTLIESLAIIAYKQPITKGQIEEIRGVNADHAVNKLMEYNLVVEKGRLDAPGKPILFGTSDEFLRHFGFKNIQSLPELPKEIENFKEEAQREIDELLKNN